VFYIYKKLIGMKTDKELDNEYFKADNSKGWIWIFLFLCLGAIGLGLSFFAVVKLVVSLLT
jgi:hypothetical protein